MNLATQNRLPGIYFQAEPPPPTGLLPRMDIAAFVGLAACGPLSTPVPVEDVKRLREIFGDDLPLAWDTATGQRQYAHLAPAVEEFFRNGGRRCWVVRVAEGATANRFALPGLVRIDQMPTEPGQANFRPALARARCEGSWSDSLRVGTVGVSEAFSVLNFSVAQAHALRQNEYTADLMALPNQLSVGDLLQFSFDDNLLLFLAVAHLSTTATSQRVRGKGHWVLDYYNDDDAPESVATDVFLLRPDFDLPLPFDEVHLPSQKGAPYEIELALELEDAPLRGDLLRIEFDDGKRLFLPITQTKATENTDVSPPNQSVLVSGEEGLWLLSEAEGVARYEQISGSLPAQTPLAERLTFELWVWRQEEVHAQISRLAFSAHHARFWGHLPTDDELFGLPFAQPLSAEASQLELKREAADPRFPLAGPADDVPLYLPLGMPRVPDFSTAPGPLPESGDALERDGVANFTADLFLDRELAEAGSATLLTTANQKYYVQGRPLRGLHSLLPLEEITLLVVPDAVQRGWRKIPMPVPVPLSAPSLSPLGSPISQADEQQLYSLTWSPVGEEVTYLLQEAADAAFTQPVTRYEGAESTTSLTIRIKCPRLYYYRVRAMRGDEVSPWSNTIFAKLPEPDFEALSFAPLAAPVMDSLEPSGSSDDQYLLSWQEVPAPEPEGTPSSLGTLFYRLEEATEPAFQSATTIYRGIELSFSVRRRAIGDEIYYYRVRAERNSENEQNQEHQISPWSTTESFSTGQAKQVWHVKSPAEYMRGDLLAVQRALLRFCAARGDLLALLALPSHYYEPDVLSFITALTSSGTQIEPLVGEVQVRPLSFGENQALSFAALYHPWILSSARHASVVPNQSLMRLMPPDGAIAGMMADKALTRGAWIAPANQPLRGVVGLAPVIDRQGWGSLFSAQVNVIRQEPRGFLLLSADTLSTAAETRPINVRRLMILLRRLVDRAGMAYVFQPNNDTFRRLVQHRFEQLLANLYTRGAFAGNSSQSAYQVVVDNSINTPTSIEQGRFIVELRVAPSQPMAFITVRFVQTEHGGLAIQEI